MVNDVTGSSTANATLGFNAGTRMLSSIPFPFSTDCHLQLKEELVPGGVDPVRSSVKHVDWANVRRWLGAVLGDRWIVQSGNILAMEGCTLALWSFANTSQRDERIDVRVMVESCAVASDGSFDFAASVEAIQNAVARNVLDGDRDPREVWVRGDFDDLGDYSLGLSNVADDSTSPDCVVVVAANSFVEIGSYGMTNAALRNAARELLEYTARRNGHPPLSFPQVTRDLVSPVGDQDPSAIGDVSVGVVRVKGIHTVFRVSFSVEREICVAGATCEGISFSRSSIHSTDASAPASGCQVHFVFSTRELGWHNVRVHFADALTMVCVSKDLAVDVTI